MDTTANNIDANNSGKNIPAVNKNQPPTKMTCMECLQLTETARQLSNQGFVAIGIPTEQKPLPPVYKQANNQAILSALLNLFNLIQ